MEDTKAKVLIVLPRLRESECLNGSGGAMSQYKWQTGDGRQISLDELSDQHVDNLIKLHKTKGDSHKAEFFEKLKDRKVTDGDIQTFIRRGGKLYKK